jgi:hypothetical protein
MNIILKEDLDVKLNGETWSGCRLWLDRYHTNNRIALGFDVPWENDGRHGWEKLAIATVNLPDEQLDPNEVFVKDYSENSGMVNTLIRLNIIETEPQRFVNSGFVTIPSYFLTNEFYDELTNKEHEHE